MVHKSSNGFEFDVKKHLPLLRGLYARKSICVKPTLRYTAQANAGSGRQAVYATCCLREFSGGVKAAEAAGRPAPFTKDLHTDWGVLSGSWGGMNGFNDRAIDVGFKETLLPGHLAFLGTRGYKGTFASLLMHPHDYVHRLGDVPPAHYHDITAKGVKALEIICGSKSAYRKEKFWINDLLMYSADNPWVKELQAAGLVKVTRSGAVSATAEGQGFARLTHRMKAVWALAHAPISDRLAFLRSEQASSNPLTFTEACEVLRCWRGSDLDVAYDYLFEAGWKLRHREA